MKMRIFIPIAVGVLVLAAFLRFPEKERNPEVTPKINGASLVNPHQPVGDSALAGVKRVDAQWVAVIPFGFARQNEPVVYFNHERQWWGERVEGTVQLIVMARNQGLKVMLKPHVWMRESWIGDFKLDSEEKWQEWERSYADFILTFARVADSLHVELFCIGTELKSTETTRSDFWRKLTKEIRKVYNGKLTYAANWDTYENIPFWSDLDYIGVNAYFPLTRAGEKPSPEIIESAWIPIRRGLRNVHEKYGKPVLFTEFGYASCDQATERPWEEYDANEPNVELQAVAYECLFRSFWNEDWVAGGFFWKWHLIRHDDRWERGRFSPQGKPAENIIREWYSSTAR